MADPLTLWNNALLMLGERALLSLAEPREPRRVLEAVWPTALRYTLEQGFWNFALRSVEMVSEPSLDPAFGYPFAFEKPVDWIRTAALAANPDFSPPLTRYSDERGHWWADIEPIFVRFVSDDGDYGGDLSLWPATFERYVETHLAVLICERLTQNASKLEDLRRLEKRRLADARAKDAMADPPGFLPSGTWVRSRNGGLSRRMGA
jgi:hypothetical protein